MEHLVEIKTDLANLMVSAAKECKTYGITFGFEISHFRLIEIAKRAIEINDEKILHELELIGYVKDHANPA